MKYEHGVILRENDVVAIEPVCNGCTGCGKSNRKWQCRDIQPDKSETSQVERGKEVVSGNKEISGVAVRQEVAAEGEA